MLYEIKYRVGTHTGSVKVKADGAAEAIGKVKRWLWRRIKPAACLEHYEIVRVTDPGVG